MKMTDKTTFSSPYFGSLLETSIADSNTRNGDFFRQKASNFIDALNRKLLIHLQGHRISIHDPIDLQEDMWGRILLKNEHPMGQTVEMLFGEGFELHHELKHIFIMLKMAEIADSEPLQNSENLRSSIYLTEYYLAGECSIRKAKASFRIFERKNAAEMA
jgi:hypothetical protein